MSLDSQFGTSFTKISYLIYNVSILSGYIYVHYVEIYSIWHTISSMQGVIFVFFTHLFLLCWCEIILNVKSLPDFLWGFSFDHVGYCFACDIKQTFDVQVVGSLKYKEIHEKNNFSVQGKF